MSSDKTLTTKYFPFAPKIPWQVKYGRYIIPYLNKPSWDEALKNRDIVILAFGGLIESFFSLSLAEALNKLHPEKKIYWKGNSKFNILKDLQGITHTQYFDFGEEIVRQYPLPIFMDKKSYTFFNCLNNYIDVYTYLGENRYRSYLPIFKQIFVNSCLEWSSNYVPKLRNLTEPPEFKIFDMSKKFDFNKPFIFILPDKTGWSIHEASCLNWNVQSVRSFLDMIQAKGINAVIMTPYTEKYYGTRALVLSPNLYHLLWILSRAKGILAKDVDILLLGLLISKADIFAELNKKEFSIKTNKKYIGAENKIVELEDISPFEVYTEIK